MLRTLEDLLDRTLFDDPAGVHHDDPLAQARNQRHVVRDQHHRGVQLAVKLLHQLDDLGLDRDVKGRGRLVGDQQVGFVGKTHRDHRPLTHAAGELMRVVLDARFGGRHSHPLQELDDTSSGEGFREALVRRHGLLDLAPDPGDRVQRGHGVLEDHRDVVAAEVADLLIRHLGDVFTAEQDPAGHDLARVGQESEDGECRHRLAATGLPDDAERLAGVDVEGHTVDCVDDTPRREELCAEILDLKQRLCQ